jgi:endonuclease III-like uncharacterized protein
MAEIKVNYDVEILEDDVLKDIRVLCLQFLDNPSSINTINTEELYISFNFLNNKFNEIKELQNSFNVPHYFQPMTEIAHSLDNITMSDINGIAQDTAKRIMIINLGTALEACTFMYGIVNQMLIIKNKESL